MSINMALNINSFLTNSDAKEFYEKVLSITHDIEEITKGRVLIFGGLLRRIIETHFNPDLKFETPDVDIWINRIFPEDPFYDVYREFGHSHTSWDRERRRIFTEISKKHTTDKDFIVYPQFGHRINYGVCTMTIDDIKFDMCTNINLFTTFTKLSDYSCNNLYTDTITGNLAMRVKTQYNIDDCIKHIRDKKLYEIYDEDFITNHLINYYPKHASYYDEKKKYRKEKMLSYGYSY